MKIYILRNSEINRDYLYLCIDIRCILKGSYIQKWKVSLLFTQPVITYVPDLLSLDEHIQRFLEKLSNSVSLYNATQKVHNNQDGNPYNPSGWNSVFWSGSRGFGEK